MTGKELKIVKKEEQVQGNETDIQEIMLQNSDKKKLGEVAKWLSSDERTNTRNGQSYRLTRHKRSRYSYTDVTEQLGKLK